MKHGEHDCPNKHDDNDLGILVTVAENTDGLIGDELVQAMSGKHVINATTFVEDTAPRKFLKPCEVCPRCGRTKEQMARDLRLIP